MKSVLDEIYSAYNFHANGSYVVTTGKNLCIFLKDGRCVAQRTDLKNIYHIAFVSDERILIDCGSAKDFLVVSLRNGKSLKHIPRPKMDYIAPRFAVSSDKSIVYGCFFLRTVCHVIKIDIEKATTLFSSLTPGLRVTNDISLDKEDNLCILQGQLGRVARKDTSFDGIRYESLESNGNTVNWKARWTFEHPRQSEFLIDNAESVVTNDLHVFNPTSGTIYNLLENNDVDLEKQNTVDIWGEDETKKYILFNNGSHENIVIDKDARKIIARYNGCYSRGCIVEDSFWLWTEEGFAKKIFPFIEEKKIRTPRLSTMW